LDDRRAPARQEIAMLNFIESSAGRIAARIQAIGVGFDPEVLSLPGGSVIATVLWLYAGTRLRFKRGAPRKLPVAESVPTPACAGCPGHH
jgi:hypothetical protein